MFDFNKCIKKFIFLLFLIDGIDSSLLVTNKEMSVLVDISPTPPFCTPYDDKKTIRKKLSLFKKKRIHGLTNDSIIFKLPNKDMYRLRSICNANMEMKDILRHLYSNGSVSIPGTKWCGPGNTAYNYTDLGSNEKVDKCCREHDHCPKYLWPGACEGGICNETSFIICHCSCDKKFRRCLKDVNSYTSIGINIVVFVIYGLDCMVEKPPCKNQSTDPDCELELVHPSNYDY